MSVAVNLVPDASRRVLSHANKKILAITVSKHCLEVLRRERHLLPPHVLNLAPVQRVRRERRVAKRACACDCGYTIYPWSPYALHACV